MPHPNAFVDAYFISFPASIASIALATYGLFTLFAFLALSSTAHGKQVYHFYQINKHEVS